jgi:hypothetical protein
MSDQRRHITQDREPYHLEGVEPDLEEDRRHGPGQVHRQGSRKASCGLSLDPVEEPGALSPHAEADRDLAQRSGSGIATLVKRVAQPRNLPATPSVLLDDAAAGFGGGEAVEIHLGVGRLNHLGALAGRSRD